MIKQPNYTQCPNVFFDEILKELSGSETKVFCVIMRKTFGWQKVSDRISYSQIMELSGISSKATINEAIKELERKGYVLAERAKQTTTYSIIVSENEPVQKLNQYEKCTDSGTESVPVEEKTGTKTVHTKESDIKKLSKEIYIEIENYYLQAFKEVKPEGTTLIDYKKVRPRLKTLLQKLSKEKILAVIEKAKTDQWNLDGGFSLMGILTDYQINKLLNGSVQSKPSYQKPELKVNQRTTMLDLEE
jgi:phage replication O-like protein O